MSGPRPTCELGVLVGLILTDGSISRGQIEFTGKSEILHKIFEEKMRKCFGVEEVWKGKDCRQEEIKRTKVSNREIAQKLQESVETFHQWIFKLSEEEMKEVLRVMFSTDGCVVLYPVWNRRKKVWEIKKYVKFASKSPSIRKTVLKMLEVLGFSPTEREINDEIVLFKKKDILRFAKEIGFVPGVKVTKNSKRWFGFEKNEILDLAVKTFGLKKKELESLKSKDDVISFLRSLI